MKQTGHTLVLWPENHLDHPDLSVFPDLWLQFLTVNLNASQIFTHCDFKAYLKSDELSPYSSLMFSPPLSFFSSSPPSLCFCSLSRAFYFLPPTLSSPTCLLSVYPQAAHFQVFSWQAAAPLSNFLLPTATMPRAKW